MSPKTLLQQLGVMAEAPHGVQRLRELILQLAVRGKLVPQDPNDEPASALLERIEARLGAHADPPRRVYSRAEAFSALSSLNLPKSWEAVPVGKVLTVQNGFAFDSHGFNESNEGLPLIRIRDLGTNRNTVFYAGDFRDEFLVYAGDYLVGMDGNFELYEWCGPQALLNQRVCRLLNFTDQVNRRFVFWMVQLALNEIHGATSFVTVKHLSSKSIQSIRLPLPPLAEQRRIVAKVDELMALCDELEARQQRRALTRTRLNRSALHHLTAATDDADLAEHWQRLRENFHLLYDTPETVAELRQTVLQSAVRGKLVPQDPNDEPASVLLERIAMDQKLLHAAGKLRNRKILESVRKDEIAFSLPEGWVWTRLGEVILTLGDGPHFSPRYAPKEDGIPFLSTRNVRVDGFDFSDVKYVSAEDHREFTKKIKAELGDVLYTKGGTTGIAKVNDLPFEFSVWVHVAVLKVPLNSLNSQYLALALNSPHCYAQAQRYTHGSSNSDLGLTRMINITLPLPPLDEQRRIVAKVDELMALCDRLEARLTSARDKAAHLAASVVHYVAAA